MGYGIKIRVINYTIQTCFISVSVGYQKFSQNLHKFSSVISRDQTPTPHFFVKIDNYSNGWTPTGCSRLHSQNITHTSSTQLLHEYSRMTQYYDVLTQTATQTYFVSKICSYMKHCYCQIGLDRGSGTRSWNEDSTSSCRGWMCFFFPIVCVTKLPFKYKVYG